MLGHHVLMGALLSWACGMGWRTNHFLFLDRAFLMRSAPTFLPTWRRRSK